MHIFLTELKIKQNKTTKWKANNNSKKDKAKQKKKQQQQQQTQTRNFGTNVYVNECEWYIIIIQLVTQESSKRRKSKFSYEESNLRPSDY